MMIVILRRIPANTKRNDIYDFMDATLKGGLLQKSGHIEEIQILVLKDTQTNDKEYHALITIDSDEAAQRVIKKLNGKVFKNKHIAVREYFYRSWHNDPRINVNESVKNKREGNRRGVRLEVVEDTSAKFSSNRNFHRLR